MVSPTCLPAGSRSVARTDQPGAGAPPKSTTAVASTVPAALSGSNEVATGRSVRATLRDPAGKQVGDTIRQPVPHEHTRSYGFTGFEVTGHWDVAGAEAWSAETPRRYSVTAELVDPSGRVAHVETQHVGLRRVEVRDRQLLVNGQPVWIFGVKPPRPPTPTGARRSPSTTCGPI